jgi:hypothetical protein
MPKVIAYMQEKSPFIWLKWRDPITGNPRYENTKRRPKESGTERYVKKRIHFHEGRLIDSDQVVSGGEAWHLWLPQWLKLRYQRNRHTQRKYMGKWKIFSIFLAQNKIPAPRCFVREHVFQYLDWRMSIKKQKSGRTPKLNTALADIRFIGMVLREAKERGYCDSDVTRKHGIMREDAEEKPEYTDDEIVAIRKGLIKKSEWMSIAFEIALQTGCRHKDTRIRRKNVNFETGEIFFPEPKGGKKKAFVHVASDSVLQYLKRIFKDGGEITWNLPNKELAMTGIIWTKFFREIKLSHLCFHSTRVTYISRGERAGVPESVMCKQVNHASVLVHRIYSRRPSSERRAFANAVQLPSPLGSSAK